MPAGTRIGLAFDDTTLAGLPAAPIALNAADSPTVWKVPAADNEVFLASLRKGQVLRLALLPPAGQKLPQGTTDKVEISLKGAVAALIWVDERQQRLDTLTAMVKRGAKPASAVPAPPPEPVVRAVAPVLQTKLPAKPPAAVTKVMTADDCGSDTPGDAAKPTVDRLSATTVLWGAVCMSGAYDQMVRYFIAGTTRSLRPSSAIRRVRIPKIRRRTSSSIPASMPRP